MIKILILIAVNLLTYIRTINYEPIVDDQKVPRTKGKNFIDTFFLHLHGLGYSNYRLARAQRIVVHAAVAVAIYFAFGANEISFFAALLFSINPANNQGSIWLNGIGYSMSTLCVLLMMMWPAFSILPYMYTMAWHITPVFAPLLFLFKGPWWLALLVLPYIGLAWLVNWKIPLFKAQGDATLDVRVKVKPTAMKSVYLKKFGFIIKTYGYYFWFALLPRRVGLYHTFGYSFALAKKDTEKWQALTPLFFVSLATIIVNIICMLKFWGTSLSFGLIWYNLFIAQWCNVVTYQQTIAERYVYLPNAGLMLALSWAIFQAPYPYSYLILTAIGTFYFTRLMYIIPMYRSQYYYVEHSIVDFPDQWALYLWRGLLARAKGKKFSELNAYATGLVHRPNDYKLNFNLAHVLASLGYLVEADKYLIAAGESLKDEYNDDPDTVKIIEEERERLQAKIDKATGKNRIITPR